MSLSIIINVLIALRRFVKKLIFVPHTPNSELAKSLRKIADTEAEAGVHFNVIETGGLSMRRVLQRSNPWL